MTIQNNLISQPVDAFVFDCDGTLSLLEGIEVLAEENGVGERVAELTEYAMSEAGITPSLYQERIGLVKPSRRQVIALAQKYFNQRVPDIVKLIEILQGLGKAVYIVSAGVNPAVILFAEMLGVTAENVFAVDLKFSQDGSYEGYNVDAYPAQAGGKQVIAQQLKQKHPRIIWIGDGMNDAVVKPEVTRFIGYGGAFYREKIAKLSDFYIKSKSIAPVLVLGLTANEAHALTGEALTLYQEVLGAA